MGTVLSGISGLCGIDSGIFSGGYRCAFCQDGLEAEGVTSLVSYDENLIDVKFRKVAMRIEGQNLSISRFGKGILSVKGRVDQITLLRV